MDEKLGKCLPVHLIAILIKQNGATKKIVSSKTLRIGVRIPVALCSFTILRRISKAVIRMGMYGL